MTDNKGAAHNKLLAAYRALEDECAGQDKIPNEIDARLGFLKHGSGEDRCPTVDHLSDRDRAGGPDRHALSLSRLCASRG